MTKLPLNPTKSPTVQAVGTWAYLRNYLPLTTGFIEVEVIPEPDNPYDEHAISFRHEGNVLGYVPRMDTHRYWNIIARVIESGMTPTATAQYYFTENPDGDPPAFVELHVHLPARTPYSDESGLIPKSKHYHVPPAYTEPDPELQQLPEPEPEPETPKKRGFLSRLFGK